MTHIWHTAGGYTCECGHYLGNHNHTTMTQLAHMHAWHTHHTHPTITTRN